MRAAETIPISYQAYLICIGYVISSAVLPLLRDCTPNQKAVRVSAACASSSSKISRVCLVVGLPSAAVPNERVFSYSVRLVVSRLPVCLYVLYTQGILHIDRTSPEKNLQRSSERRTKKKYFNNKLPFFIGGYFFLAV